MLYRRTQSALKQGDTAGAILPRMVAEGTTVSSGLQLEGDTAGTISPRYWKAAGTIIYFFHQKERSGGSNSAEYRR